MAVEKWMRMKCSHYGDSVKRALSLVILVEILLVDLICECSYF